MPWDRPNAERAFHSWITDAVQTLKAQGWSIGPSTKIAVESWGSDAQIVSLPLGMWQGNLVRAHDFLMALPSAAPVVQQTAPFLGISGPVDSSGRPIPDPAHLKEAGFVSWVLLFQALESVAEGEDEWASAASAVRRFEAYAIERTELHTFFAPLHNLRLDTDVYYEFSNGVVLRTLSPMERGLLVDRVGMSWPGTYSSHDVYRIAAELRVEEEYSIRSPLNPSLGIRRISTAHRVLHLALPGLYGIRNIHETSRSLSSSSSSEPILAPRAFAWDAGSVQLQQSDCDLLAKVDRELTPILDSTSYPLMLSEDRLYEAAMEVRPAPKLIDLVIGLESILCPGRAGSSKTLARRGAILLSKEIGARRELRKFLESAYNERTALVHGERYETSFDVQRLQSATRDILLAALRHWQADGAGSYARALKSLD